MNYGFTPRKNHQYIPGKKIAGVGDILTYKYDQINLEIVEDVMRNPLPEFSAMIEP
ncbi:HepT-like ribonuclease domain-containing protein [Crocosphaera sp. UHCC 0190]|uniref:HepT-like ribonuclease domain-containing protein n=1 Tax=Crocosphaera sp. UHCC 0190 TaxID=3110246 RepID=UPI002B1FD90C|nr:HepT-like ribonuclease domain-containing protein [Crocosphaera sp. UHCC 0190]MEA5511898.1 HepT-like ribonuclease domain-containing protein [Crocosphaera sp. UHCC 0190]